MPNITYNDTAISIEEPETILEGLEREGFKIPFSCRAGLCHSCMMQAEEQPPVTAQQGLSDNQKAQNFFLACSCIPKVDMQINLIGDTNRIQGKVVDKKLLNNDVLGLFIQIDCRWFPGQYLNVWFDDTQGRSYSIASLCDDNKIIELHIKRHDQGLVSRWLHDEVMVDQSITLSKPTGNCFYTDEHQGKPILMAATGTGLAPLYGVLAEALSRQHSSPVYLYAAAGEPQGLYYVDELKTIAENNNNVHYIPIARRAVTDADDIVQGDVVDLVQESHQDLNGWKVFLCGSPDMIKKLQRHCFFKGAAVTDILVDAFIIEKGGQ
ncbi:MAG: 2Fe-2S iron-sulfur cluster-binding protein [Cellvibrionaceae bacterium]